MGDYRKKFCLAPFHKLETSMDGTAAPCCSSWIKEHFGSLDSHDLEEIWNGESAQKIRASIHDGSFRFCRKDRCAFLIHDALPDRDSINDPHDRTIIETGATRMERGPDQLVLAHDVTCNLSCPSCRGRLLVADAAQEEKLDRVFDAILRPALTSGLPIELSLSGQGDPWSSKHYLSILRLLSDHDLPVKLNLQTSGVLMSEARWREFEGLSRYRPRVDISIDACHPWTFATIRRNGDWETLQTNLQFIRGLRRMGEISEFSLNATVQADNFHEMADIVRLGKQLGCDGVRFRPVQNTGDHLGSTFYDLNVADPRHFLHDAFLETIRDPIFEEPICSLGDIKAIRDAALEATQPSDVAGRPASDAACLEAISHLVDRNEFSRAAALAAYARIHWPENRELGLLGGMILQASDFTQLATYRYRELVDLDTTDPNARLALGMALFDLNELEEGCRSMIEACLCAPQEPLVCNAVARFFADVLAPGDVMGRRSVDRSEGTPEARAA